jgi:hypothetical protein
VLSKEIERRLTVVGVSYHEIQRNIMLQEGRHRTDSTVASVVPLLNSILQCNGTL